MGSSAHVVGFGKTDAKFIKMYSAYESCVAAGIDIPEELLAYFNWEEPNKNGIEIDLIDDKTICSRYKGEDMEGYDVDLSMLPDSIHTIRFYNSY